MAEKMVVKIRVFGLAHVHIGSSGSFNDGDMCHISLKACRFINHNIYRGSCMAEFCNPTFFKMAAK